MHIVTNKLYRVKAVSNAWLVETSDKSNALNELVEFCAEKSASGYQITSVTEIFATSKETPRVTVLSTSEFKRALKSAQQAYGKRYQLESTPRSVQEIVERAESEGWSISRVDDPEDQEIQLELGKHSPAGEDFFILLRGLTPLAVVDSLNEYILDFDVDDHVKEIMGARGAPSLSVLVEDAKAIEKMLRDLLFAITHKP